MYHLFFCQPRVFNLEYLAKLIKFALIFQGQAASEKHQQTATLTTLSSHRCFVVRAAWGAPATAQLASGENGDLVLQNPGPGRLSGSGQGKVVYFFQKYTMLLNIKKIVLAEEIYKASVKFEIICLNVCLILNIVLSFRHTCLRKIMSSVRSALMNLYYDFLLDCGKGF